MSNYEEMKELAKALTEPRRVMVERSTRTGVPSLDLALGGGLPAGITEIFGGPSVGKSSLAYEILGTAQTAGFVVALAASEYLDIPRMEVHNVDLDDLILIKGKGSAVLDGCLDFLKNCRTASARCVLILDSATALRPDLDQGGQANYLLELFFIAAKPLLPRNSSIVVINQVRQKKSLEEGGRFLRETDSTSKKMVEMFSARLKLSRAEVSEDAFDLVVDVLSNEGGLPSCVLTVPFIKRTGINTMVDLVRCGVACGAIHKNGSWYYLGEDRGVLLGEGEKNVADCLALTAGYAETVLDKVMHGWL